MQIQIQPAKLKYYRFSNKKSYKAQIQLKEIENPSQYKTWANSIQGNSTSTIFYKHKPNINNVKLQVKKSLEIKWIT